MTLGAADFTIGVEEEYQIVHPQTRALRARLGRVLPRAREALGDAVQPELHQVQIEMATSACRTLAEVRAAVVRARRGVIAAAARDGDRIAAAGTHPFSPPSAQPLTAKDRYQAIAATYAYLAHELVIFGCHVHVGLDDRAALIPVLNRLRPWLAPLLALSANSPFWLGTDTGYASYRSELWGRWPLAGPPGHFASRAEYDTLVRALVDIGAIDDATNIYWDARLPAKTPTVEVRVADVCLTVDEAVMIAGLTRALVQTCYAAALRDEPFAAARPEVLRHAHWRAARYGLEADLADVAGGRTVPAGALIEAFLLYVRPALEEQGDWDEVAGLVRDTRARERRGPPARGLPARRPAGGRRRPHRRRDGARGRMTRPSRTSTWGARGAVFPTGAGRAAGVSSSILVLFSGRLARGRRRSGARGAAGAGGPTSGKRRCQGGAVTTGVTRPTRLFNHVRPRGARASPRRTR